MSTSKGFPVYIASHTPVICRMSWLLTITTIDVCVYTMLSKRILQLRWHSSLLPLTQLVDRLGKYASKTSIAPLSRRCLHPNHNNIKINMLRVKYSYINKNKTTRFSMCIYVTLCLIRVIFLLFRHTGGIRATPRGNPLAPGAYPGSIPPLPINEARSYQPSRYSGKVTQLRLYGCYDSISPGLTQGTEIYHDVSAVYLYRPMYRLLVNVLVQIRTVMNYGLWDNINPVLMGVIKPRNDGHVLRVCRLLDMMILPFWTASKLSKDKSYIYLRSVTIWVDVPVVCYFYIVDLHWYVQRSRILSLQCLYTSVCQLQMISKLNPNVLMSMLVFWAHLPNALYVCITALLCHSLPPQDVYTTKQHATNDHDGQVLHGEPTCGGDSRGSITELSDPCTQQCPGNGCAAMSYCKPAVKARTAGMHQRHYDCPGGKTFPGPPNGHVKDVRQVVVVQCARGCPTRTHETLTQAAIIHDINAVNSNVRARLVVLYYVPVGCLLYGVFLARCNNIICPCKLTVHPRRRCVPTMNQWLWIHSVYTAHVHTDNNVPAVGANQYPITYVNKRCGVLFSSSYDVSKYVCVLIYTYHKILTVTMLSHRKNHDESTP